MSNGSDQKTQDGAVERLQKLLEQESVRPAARLLVIWGGCCVVCALALPISLVAGARPFSAGPHMWPVVVLGLGVLTFGFALPAVLLHAIARVVRDD